MATTTNYGFPTPDDTALVKDGASAIRSLGTAVDTTTKNLNPSTTLGDIEYRSSTANTNTRLGIGTSGQVLTVSGGVPAWTTSSAGAYTTLASGNLSSTSVNLTSISQDYKDLVLVIDNPYVNVANSLGITCNNYTTGNHYFNVLFGATSASSQDSSANLFRVDTNLPITSSGVYSYWTFPNYTQARPKIINHTYRITTAGSTNRTQFFGNLDTAAISSIQIRCENGTSTFSGGTYILYGVK